MSLGYWWSSRRKLSDRNKSKVEYEKIYVQVSCMFNQDEMSRYAGRCLLFLGEGSRIGSSFSRSNPYIHRVCYRPLPRSVFWGAGDSIVYRTLLQQHLKVAIAAQRRGLHSSKTAVPRLSHRHSVSSLVGNVGGNMWCVIYVTVNFPPLGFLRLPRQQKL